jgi:hypothetical protein
MKHFVVGSCQFIEQYYSTIRYSFIAYLVQSNIVVDTYATFACGALAGGIAATLTTPADVAKTYRQIELGRNQPSSNTRGCVHCSSSGNNASLPSNKTLAILSHIVRVEGPKGLFAGLLLFLRAIRT